MLAIGLLHLLQRLSQFAAFAIDVRAVMVESGLVVRVALRCFAEVFRCQQVVRAFAVEVLLPAVIADQAQYSGWIVQGIGILIPFALALVFTVAGRGRSRAR